MFVESCKFSLKAALLRNGMIHQLVLIAHSVRMKEIYENVDLLLKTISYSKYQLKVCGDLKSQERSLATQSSAVFSVTGAAKQKRDITKLWIGPSEKTQFQGKIASEINS